MSDDRVTASARRALEELRSSLSQLEPRSTSTRVGEVTSVADGVATVVGLGHPFAGERLDVGAVPAVADELTEQGARIILLGPTSEVEAGSVVHRSGRMLEVPAGPGLLGRVVDPLGRPVDGRGPLSAPGRVRVMGPPVALVDREPVGRSLRTGIFAVDTMIPVGRGQRQLIIGDRATGKVDLALDILAAMDPEVIGIYVAIGQRGASIASNLERLRAARVLDRGFAVVTDADAPAGLVHLTPMAATAMAESFAMEGHDVVIVYDDLTTHADVHRSLALLLGRSVGREAFPVDVFYEHARLLERACQYGAALGGGSITAFPLIETQLGDLAAYIPTNMVSITDGQVRLDAGLVAADVVPAIDVALSVSRVGGKVQPRLIRGLAGRFKNRYAQFLELETFARFGTRLEPASAAVVEWGRRVRRVLRQAPGVSCSWTDTVARLLLMDLEGLRDVAWSDVDAVIGATVEGFGADRNTPAEAIDLERPFDLDPSELRTIAEQAFEAARARPSGGAP